MPFVPIQTSTSPSDKSSESLALRSWRKTTHRDVRLRWKVGVSLILAVSLALFANSLLRPFSRADLQVLVLGPLSAGQASLASASEIDLPWLLSIANKNSIENAIREHHRSILVPHGEPTSLSHVAKGLESKLRTCVHANTTLVVYVSGVLAIDKPEPSLCDNSGDAVHAGTALNLAKLISQLQQLRCRQVLLCIDATTPMSSGPSHIANSIAWKNLGAKLEKALLQDGTTPVAIQLALNTIDPRQCVMKPSPIANKWSSAFESDVLAKGLSLHDFQQSLTAAKDAEKIGGLTCQSMRWMVSADWPLDSHSVHLPILDRMREASNSTELVTTTTANATASGFAIASNETDMDVELATADTPKLIALCESLFSKWRKAKPAVPLALLQLPTPLTKQQTHHFAYHSFLSAFAKLKSSFHLVPSSVDHAQMRFLAQCMSCFDQGLPLPANAPEWIRRLPDTYPKRIDKLSTSLVANATLEALGVLNYPVDYSGEAILQEVARQVSSQAMGSSEPFEAWIKRLQEESQNFAEVTWSAWVLAQPNISWELKQRFIEARLLATRLASDPLTVEWSSEHLHEADAARIHAERTLADRSQADWEREASQEIQTAVSKFREGIDIVVRVRSRLQKYNDEIVANPLQSGGSNEGMMHSLPHAERSTAIAELEQCSKLWFDAVAPWNRTLAKQWVDGISQTKSQLAATDREMDQRIQSVVTFDRFAHSQIDSLLQWASTHASKIPVDSSLWIFVKRFWHAKPELLVDLVARAKPAMLPCVQLNLDRLGREQYGATSQELIDIETQMSWWSDTALALGYKIVHPPKSTLRLRGDASLDLTAHSALETCIEIDCSPNERSPIELKADFDTESAEVHVDGKRMTRQSQLTVPFDRTQKGPLRVAVAVARKQGYTNNKPVLLIATRGAEQRRAVISLHSPHDPMVRVDFENMSRVSESRDKRSTDSLLFPNQLNPISIAIANATSSTATYSCRLLIPRKVDAEPPIGALSNDEATRWIHTNGEPIVIAVSKPVLLATGQKEAVSFSAAPLPPDQLAPNVQKLLLETKNELTGQIQLDAWTPRVVHPALYVQPNVSFDPVQQSVTVRLKPKDQSYFAKDGISVEMEVVNPTELDVVSRASALLHLERMESQSVLSTTACRSGKALLCIIVDRWSPSFLYEIDLNRAGDYEPSKQFAALRIQLTDPHDAVVAKSRSVEVRVDAVMNDDGFEERRDCIDVGFDRNANRSLEDDVTMQLNGTKERKFVWGGTDQSGSILIRSEVDSHRVKLPAQVDWNRWVPAMATLRRSNHMISSNAIPCVFDRVPPKIESVRIQGKQPALLGLPLCVEVQIDDEGLSGGAIVEGGWSTTGELEFYEQLKIVPGIYRDRDRWLLAVPTDSIPSGISTLLVRARDRSGNISRTYTVRAELLRQDELDAREASMTTTLRGDVVHFGVPQNGISIRLLASPPSNKDTDASKVAKESKVPEPIATTRTDPAGRFVFDKVTKGAYVLEFTGIVQGMRVKRTQELTINPFSGPAETQMRLDQKP